MNASPKTPHVRSKFLDVTATLATVTLCVLWALLIFNPGSHPLSQSVFAVHIVWALLIAIESQKKTIVNVQNVATICVTLSAVTMGLFLAGFRLMGIPSELYTPWIYLVLTDIFCLATYSWYIYYDHYFLSGIYGSVFFGICAFAVFGLYPLHQVPELTQLLRTSVTLAGLSLLTGWVLFESPTLLIQKYCRFNVLDHLTSPGIVKIFFGLILVIGSYTLYYTVWTNNWFAACVVIITILWSVMIARWGKGLDHLTFLESARVFAWSWLIISAAAMYLSFFIADRPFTTLDRFWILVVLPLTWGIYEMGLWDKVNRFDFSAVSMRHIEFYVSYPNRSYNRFAGIRVVLGSVCWGLITAFIAFAMASLSHPVSFGIWFYLFAAVLSASHYLVGWALGGFPENPLMTGMILMWFFRKIIFGYIIPFLTYLVAWMITFPSKWKVWTFAILTPIAYIVFYTVHPTNGFAVVVLCIHAFWSILIARLTEPNNNNIVHHYLFVFFNIFILTMMPPVVLGLFAVDHITLIELVFAYVLGPIFLGLWAMYTWENKPQWAYGLLGSVLYTAVITYKLPSIIVGFFPMITENALLYAIVAMVILPVHYALGWLLQGRPKIPFTAIAKWLKSYILGFDPKAVPVLRPTFVVYLAILAFGRSPYIDATLWQFVILIVAVSIGTFLSVEIKNRRMRLTTGFTEVILTTLSIFVFVAPLAKIAPLTNQSPMILLTILVTFACALGFPRDHANNFRTNSGVVGSVLFGIAATIALSVFNPFGISDLAATVVASGFFGFIGGGALHFIVFETLTPALMKKNY